MRNILNYRSLNTNCTINWPNSLSKMLSPSNVVGYYFISGSGRALLWSDFLNHAHQPAFPQGQLISHSRGRSEWYAVYHQNLWYIPDTALQLWILKGTVAKKLWLLHCLGQLPPKTDQQYRPLVTFNINKCHPLKRLHNWKAKPQLNFARAFPQTNSQALHLCRWWGLLLVNTGCSISHRPQTVFI